jgi:hypothetical protein
MAALAASRTKNTFYQAKHNSLRFKLGSFNKATVAIANRLARAIYFIIKESDTHFKELGSERADTKIAQVARLTKKLKLLGYEVELKI